ncbi:MAG: hypothetical protein CFH35_02034, partial [Alphaproteobacteria bacterium MarineAlpha9_Bin5]
LQVGTSVAIDLQTNGDFNYYRFRPHNVLSPINAAAEIILD